MFKDIVTSLRAYGKAHRFIKENKLWGWIFLPGIFYTFLMIVAYLFFAKMANEFVGFLAIKFGLQDWLKRMESSWLGFLFTFTSMMVWVIEMILFLSLFKYIFLIVGSPVFSYLSEKTEAIINGKDFPFSFSQLLKDILRGIRIAIRNLLWQTVYMFSLFIVSFIPIIGWFCVLLPFLIECYYFGFSMLDYSMERHKKTASQSIYFIGHHKGLAIGNGFGFYCLHLIPLIGWLIAPAYAVIAATLSLSGTNLDEKNVND